MALLNGGDFVTALILILGAGTIANTVLLSLLLLTVRDLLHTRQARGSVRRGWEKVERLGDE